jgi:hypothetical protein
VVVAGWFGGLYLAEYARSLVLTGLVRDIPYTAPGLYAASLPWYGLVVGFAAGALQAALLGSRGRWRWVAVSAAASVVAWVVAGLAAGLYADPDLLWAQPPWDGRFLVAGALGGLVYALPTGLLLVQLLREGSAAPVVRQDPATVTAQARERHARFAAELATRRSQSHRGWWQRLID